MKGGKTKGKENRHLAGNVFTNLKEISVHYVTSQKDDFQKSAQWSVHEI